MKDDEGEPRHMKGKIRVSLGQGAVLQPDGAGQFRRQFLSLKSPWDAEIFSLALPALLTTLLDPLMGLIDASIIGRVGTVQLAAVSCSTVLSNFSTFIFNFLLYTTTPRIAAAASRNDMDQVSKITAHGLWLAIAIGVITSTVLFFGCPVFFTILGATPEVMGHAVNFFRIRCLATPAIMMTYVMSGVFRGFKDTQATLVSSTWSNVAHIILDYICIFGLNMGALGAAVATAISLWLNWAILGSSIVFKHEYLKLEDMKQFPSFSDVAPMLRNGILLSTRSILAMSTVMRDQRPRRASTVRGDVSFVLASLTEYINLFKIVIILRYQLNYQDCCVLQDTRSKQVERNYFMVKTGIGGPGGSEAVEDVKTAVQKEQSRNQQQQKHGSKGNKTFSEENMGIGEAVIIRNDPGALIISQLCTSHGDGQHLPNECTVAPVSTLGRLWTSSALPAIEDKKDDAPDLERFLRAATPRLESARSQLSERFETVRCLEYFERISANGIKCPTLGGPRGPSTCFFVPFLSSVQIFEPTHESDDMALSFPDGLDAWPSHMKRSFSWSAKISWRGLPLYQQIMELCEDEGMKHVLTSRK
eukprot:jgi/Picre1/33915/NNA_001394.t1